MITEQDYRAELTRRHAVARAGGVRRRRRWYEHTTEAIYGYRARKHEAILGVPLIGRHWAYVGRTNNLDRRHREHLIGGGEYAAVAKPWNDLEPRRYILFPRKRRREITTHLLELMCIRVLLPVYNVSMNRRNPRRVPPWDQARQRAKRDVARATGAPAPAVRRLQWQIVVALAVVGVVTVAYVR